MKPVRPADLTPIEQPRKSSLSISRRSLILGGLGVAALTGPAFAGYAGVEAASMLDITRYKLKPRNWPAGQRLSISVIADLHAGGPNMGVERIREIVDASNALRPDIVLLLGDFVATHRFVTELVPPQVWSAELKRLNAPLGVHAILGNHDWWYLQSEIRLALARANIPLMENDAVLLGEPGSRFWLAGLGDQLALPLGRGHFRGADDLPATMAKITTDDPVVLMVHEPDIFTKVPDRVSITLAGHTHGGQMRLPLVWPAFVPSQYGARFAYGHIVEGGRDLIVSGGLGTSILPMRIGVPPEIVHVELG
ncbi:metallophosphoesterase [Pseudorhodoplanes sp.]|uniref:metallophosphoesterase n=1 Tax=Pseudorhodoplanes sp. TaxID=1934341 RepID=UPI002C4A80F8|nr:metallophosphoesterase [Pseudorhodoplanes sp.]HWV55608.1 metallophosphoesterase [Pseudorhodoplanes sp.]